MSALPETLTRLRQLRADTDAQRSELLATAEREGRKDLSVSETTEFRSLTATIEALDERMKDISAEIKRSGRGDPAVDSVRQATALVGGGGGSAEAWARTAAQALRQDLGGSEKRAVISGSVDVPSLLPLPVAAIPHPTRLIDLLVNRQQVDWGMAYETYVQTARTNNAAPVADLATKPTSVLTVRAVQDRCRVFAHLSEPVPYRIWTSNEAITRWLIDEMYAGVSDAVEHAAINGNGAGEMPTGVLGLEGLTTPSDRTHVPWTTDLPTTLRSAVTTMQNLGEQVNGWALNPADAQSVDLLRWNTSGGFLSGGYDTGPVTQSLLSDNIFGSTRPRVVSPSVPAGTAILADWSQLKLFLNGTMQLLANAFGDSLFQSNAVQVRAELHAGINVLRPRAFAVVDISGS
jgi:HK97 family phage major capsid protein